MPPPEIQRVREASTCLTPPLVLPSEVASLSSRDLAVARTEQVMPQSAPTSIRSSPYTSQDVSRNVSRDTSRHGPGPRSKAELSITAEEGPEGADEDETSVAAARELAEAWTGAELASRVTSAALLATPDESVVSSSDASCSIKMLEPLSRGSIEGARKPGPRLVVSIPSQEDGWEESRGYGGDSTATTADVSVAGSAGRSDSLGASMAVPRGGGAGGGLPDHEPAPTEESMPGKPNGAATPTSRQPPMGLGVKADPASHQHKRPVSLLCVIGGVLRAAPRCRVRSGRGLVASRLAYLSVVYLTPVGTRCGGLPSVCFALSDMEPSHDWRGHGSLIPWKRAFRFTC